MSISMNVSAGAPQRSVKAAREQSYIFWAGVLILAAIVACAIAAWFYGEPLPVDASMVGP